MKPAPPTLAPLLRSDLQGVLLSTLFLQPEREFSITELSRLTHAGLSTVHAEIARLTVAELVTERRVGQTRLVGARPEHPLSRSLTELLELTYGPAVVLADLVSGLPGVRDAFVYGSWAARRLGEPGPPPRDLDVVVIGDTPRRDLVHLSERAQVRLHRDVNVTRLAADVWDDAADPFVRTLRSRPLVRISGESRAADERAS